jgi:hypothetical protein
MNADIKAKWIAALRSGDYKQTQGRLRAHDLFCCLGVLCDVTKDDAGGKWMPDDTFVWDGHHWSTVLPGGIQRFCGMPDGVGIVSELVRLNDRGVSFAEIANYIEREL